MKKEITTILSKQQLELLKNEPATLSGPDSGLNKKHRAVLDYKKQQAKKKIVQKKSRK